MSSMSNPPGSLTDVTPYGVLTGLLWFSISDVQDKLTSITQAYTHVNPKDPTDIFCTYLIKNTKIGIPFGNLDKIREVIGKFTFEDRRNAIPFDTPKYPQLKLRDYQQVAMNEMLEYVAEGGTSFNLAGVPGCVHGDTEYLTEHGWKKISEFTEGDEILVYDKGRAFYEKPSAYVCLPNDYWYSFTTYKGKVLTKVSGDHNIVGLTSKGNISVRKAEDIYKHSSGTSFISNYSYSGRGLTLTDSEIRLAVAVAADGSYIPLRGTKNNKFRVSLKREDKIQRIEMLLKECNIEYVKSINTKGYSVYYFYHVLPTKSLLQLREANHKQRLVIAEEVFLWDGSITGKRRTFYTTLKYEADFVQEILTSVNIVSTVTDCNRLGRVRVLQGKEYTTKTRDYEVRALTHRGFSIRPRVERKGYITRIPTNEPKYCFTTTTGMWVSRYNDVITITGNSGKSYMLSNLLAQLGLKTLIIANQRMLISQLAEEAEKVLNTKVTILNAKNTEIGDINIATSQFIAQHSDVWYQIKDKISVLVLDEAEALASPTVTKIFQRCPAKYKIFISATFSRSVDNRTDALVDFAGYKKITLQATGNLIPTVVCVHCPEIFNAPMDKSMYVRAKGNFFKQSSIFNKIVQITEYSVAKNRQCLIGIDIIEMQEKLKSLLAERGIRAELLNGGTSEAERIRILEEYDKGEVKVLIGFAVLNAGLSIPKISTIIRVSTPSSKEKLEQFIGRGVRHFEGKEGCYVIDLVFKGFQNKSRQALYALKSRVEQWKVYNTDWERFKGSLTQS